MLYKVVIASTIACAAGFAPSMMIGQQSRVALSRVWMCDGEAAVAEPEDAEEKESVLDSLSDTNAALMESIKGMTLLEASELIKVRRGGGSNSDFPACKEPLRGFSSAAEPLRHQDAPPRASVAFTAMAARRSTSLQETSHTQYRAPAASPSRHVLFIVFHSPRPTGHTPSALGPGRARLCSACSPSHPACPAACADRRVFLPPAMQSCEETFNVGPKSDDDVSEE